MSVQSQLLAGINEARLAQKAYHDRLVISAGMMRSGSTLLFNILRIALTDSENGVLSSGWIRDLNRIPPADIYLIKTHHLTKLGTMYAYKVFYTYRDIRDALVSYKRKFGSPTFELATRWIRQYNAAKKYADRMISYEALTDELESTVLNVLGDLNIDALPNSILDKVPDASTENIQGGYSDVSLLHPGHKTSTKPGDWSHELDPGLIDRLNEEFRWWFEETGYIRQA